MLGDWQDVSPDKRAVADLLFDLPDDGVICEALSRGRVSPGMESNLAGLLIDTEIQDASELIGRAELADVWRKG